MKPSDFFKRGLSDEELLDQMSMTEEEEKFIEGFMWCTFFGVTLFLIFLTLIIGPKGFGW